MKTQAHLTTCPKCGSHNVGEADYKSDTEDIMFLSDKTCRDCQHNFTAHIALKASVIKLVSGLLIFIITAIYLTVISAGTFFDYLQASFIILYSFYLIYKGVSSFTGIKN
jgi:hypothetical protein